MIDICCKTHRFTITYENTYLVFTYYTYYNNMRQKIYKNENDKFIINLSNNKKLKSMIIDSHMFTWRRTCGIIYAIKLNDVGKLNLL